MDVVYCATVDCTIRVLCNYVNIIMQCSIKCCVHHSLVMDYISLSSEHL